MIYCAFNRIQVINCAHMGRFEWGAMSLLDMHWFHSDDSALLYVCWIYMCVEITDSGVLFILFITNDHHFYHP